MIIKSRLLSLVNQSLIFDTPKTPTAVLAAVNASKTIAAEVTEIKAE